MPRNEAQTRFELIDPALEDRGWNRRTDIRVEETAKPIDIVNHQPRERAAVPAALLHEAFSGNPGIQ
jgi:type I site-specific restriction endonuclease